MDLFLSVGQALRNDLFDRKMSQTYRYVWFNRMIDVGTFVEKNSKMYKRETKEPLYRWNPCFIMITIFWYSKDLEDTIRPEHFFEFQQNKFEEFYLHWFFV